MIMQTFFSTDVVKYQQQGNAQGQNQTQRATSSKDSKPYMGSFSGVAIQRWLEVTLPLMLMTGLVAMAIWIHANGRWKKATKKLEEALVWV
jgi:hypothetical protein